MKSGKTQFFFTFELDVGRDECKKAHHCTQWSEWKEWSSRQKCGMRLRVWRRATRKWKVFILCMPQHKSSVSSEKFFDFFLLLRSFGRSSSSKRINKLYTVYSYFGGWTFFYFLSSHRMWVVVDSSFSSFFRQAIPKTTATISVPMYYDGIR